MWLTLSTDLALPRILHGAWSINICGMEATCIKTKLNTVLLIEVIKSSQEGGDQEE